MITYIGKYNGESGHMMETLEELDGFLWTNSLENNYKVLGSKDQRLWVCETEPETLEIICEAFEELEFTELSENDQTLPQEPSTPNEEIS